MNLTELKASKLKSQLSDITHQVKKIVVLTQLEYDALNSTKESDNCLYLVRG